jgi:hypothetical protein
MFYFKQKFEIRAVFVLSLLIGILLQGSVYATGIPGVGEIPKIPAFLPMASSVPTTSPMPIDGTWLIEAIGKKVRIEKGRSYAIDGWQHLFVLDIQPGMVVSRDIKPTAPGKYSGYDLPWMSNFTMQVSADGSLALNIQTALMPINLKLLPMQLDNQAWFNQEMQAAGLQPVMTQSAAPAYQFTAPPGYAGGQQPVYGQPPAYSGGYQPLQPGYPVQPQPVLTPFPPNSGGATGDGQVANPDAGQKPINPW